MARMARNRVDVPLSVVLACCPNDVALLNACGDEDLICWHRECQPYLIHADCQHDEHCAVIALMDKHGSSMPMRMLTDHITVFLYSYA